MQICVHFRTLFFLSLSHFLSRHITHVISSSVEVRTLCCCTVVTSIVYPSIFPSFSETPSNALRLFQFICFFLSRALFLSDYLFVMAISNLPPIFLSRKRVCCSFCSNCFFSSFNIFTFGHYFCYHCYNNKFSWVL